MSDDETGMTRLTVLGNVHRDVSPEERLRRTVQESLRGQFDLHGELGRGDAGEIVYLASEIASKRLVALRLSRAKDGAGDGEDWWIEVVRKLDASIPALESACTECGGKLRGWSRFCRHCGADLSGVGHGSGSNTSAEDLLREVRAAARGRYEILGQMDRAEGGGIVYFAKDAKVGRIVALRLTRQSQSSGGTEVFQLHQTQVINDFRESLGVGSTAPPSQAGSGPTLPPASRETPSAQVRQPTPASAVRMPEPTMPGPPPQNAEFRKSDRSTVLKLASMGAGLVLLAVLAWKRPWQRDPIVLPPPQTLTEPAPRIDSGTVRLGVALPENAMLMIDGVQVSGDAPIRLAAGRHVMSLEARGFSPASQDIEINAGETMVWTPVLVAAAPRTPVVPRQREQPPRPQTPVVRPVDEPPATPPPINTPVTRVTCQTSFAAQNWGSAMQLCTTEADGGSASATRTIGILHDRGLGVASSPVTAATFFQRAAEAGDAYAQYRLGYFMLVPRGVRKDDRRANEWLRKAADQENPQAMFLLAESHELGRGIGRDVNRAVELYKNSAELGDMQAQHKLGVFYHDGRVLARDDALSTQWFKKSAEQGFAPSQYSLGQAYLIGTGIPPSRDDARRWIQAAATQGHKQAQKALEQLK